MRRIRELANLTADQDRRAVAVLPAAFRRRWPRTALALVVASGAVGTALSTSPGPPLAVAFVMYLVPLLFPRGTHCGCCPARCW